MKKIAKIFMIFSPCKAFERADSPTQKLITDWRNRPDLKPTVGRLVEFLVRLGREDVLTDLRNLISKFTVCHGSSVILIMFDLDSDIIFFI